ncbi:unnamed protein product [Mycena citricolor]|uniref:F-box domain-containing protein n=1 Tax=Mycena citricolor TaxID=2018698 RepID=A0AAD2HYM7_9AGAR|nr:unnamed protein product [Mycena citricolor]
MDDPKLPPELEHDIFTLLAIADLASNARLLRVAHRVKQWVEPLLYRTIYRSPYMMIKFTNAVLHELLDSKPQKCRDVVRHVMFYDVADEISLPLLESCRSIENMWAGDRVGIDLLALIGGLPNLQRLYCPFAAIQLIPRLSFDSAVAQPFARLSHLELNDTKIPGAQTDAHIAIISSLPALSHLALSGLAFHGLRLALRVLQRCPRLRLLAIIHWPTFDSSGHPLYEVLGARREVYEQNLRLVCVFKRRDTHDWLAGTRNEPDFWEYADRLVALRQTRADEARSYLVLLPDASASDIAADEALLRAHLASFKYEISLSDPGVCVPNGVSGPQSPQSMRTAYRR